jgi:hypothetical protein
MTLMFVVREATEEHPPVYRSGLEQVVSRHRDGTPEVKLIEIESHGDDLFGNWEEREWADLSQDDRDAWVSWIEEMHSLDVDVAEAEPEVRKLYEQRLSENGDGEWEDMPAHRQQMLAECIAEADAA